MKLSVKAAADVGNSIDRPTDLNDLMWYEGETISGRPFVCYRMHTTMFMITMAIKTEEQATFFVDLANENTWPLVVVCATIRLLAKGDIIQLEI